MRTAWLLVGALSPVLAQQFIVSTVAGGGAPPAQAVAARTSVGSVTGLTVDANGNLYLSAENCVFRIDSEGEMTRIAGNGRVGYSGDHGPAIDAQLRSPDGLTFDADGNLYIAEMGNQVLRKVTPDGIITTVPGSALMPGQGLSGIDFFVAAGTGGQIFLTSRWLQAVWKISPTGELSRFAGNGMPGSSGDGGPAMLAALGPPTGLAADAAGNVYIAQATAVRMESPSGIISRVAGTGIKGESGDGGPATAARLSNVRSIAADSAGNLFIAEVWRVRKVSSDRTITTIAGGVIDTIEGGGRLTREMAVPPPWAGSPPPSGMALDDSGNRYVADHGSRIRKISANGIITTFAGGLSQGYSGDGGLATSAQMQVFSPTGMAVDSTGNLLVLDQYPACVRKISISGVISAVVPSDGLTIPAGLAVNKEGDLFITDSRHGLDLNVDTSGTITMFPGNSSPTYRFPTFVAVDGADNVYVSYSSDAGVTKYTPAGIPTELATESYPGAPITVDKAGNIYAFTSEGLVKIAPNGSMTALATYGAADPADGAPARGINLLNVPALAVDRTGNVFVANSGAGLVYKLQLANVPLPPAIAAVVNSATGLQGPIAPGEIVTLYGSGIGPASLVTARLSAAGLVDKTLDGVQVLFDGKPATLVYVSDKQSAAVVPYGVSGSTAVTVSSGGRISPAMTLAVAGAAPGVFAANSSGAGQAAALNGDGSLNGAAHPVAPGGIIVLFATGEGQTAPAGIDGKLAEVPIPTPVLPVTVTIGGQKANVIYAGGAPSEVAGVLQLNVQVPSTVAAKDAVPVLLQVGDYEAATAVTIAVK